MREVRGLEFLGTNDTYGISFETACPECGEKIRVSTRGPKQRCKCGYRWRLEFVAIGKWDNKPLGVG